MKYLLSSLILLIFFFSTVQAEDYTEIKDDVEAILQAIFNDEELLQMLGSSVIENSGYDLAEIGKEKLNEPDFIQAFYSFFEKSFTSEEVKQVRAIYEDNVFKKMGREFTVSGLLAEVVKTYGDSKKKKYNEANQVVFVDATNFKKEVEDYKGLIIIDIYTDWCGACKKMRTIFESASNLYPKIKFVKINCDIYSGITKKYKITHLPTFIFLKNNKEMGRHVGVVDVKGFEKLIETVFSQKN